MTWFVSVLVNDKNEPYPLFERWNITASNANKFSIPITGLHGNR